MRYKIIEGATILGKFTTGNTVTISLYKLSDSSTVTLTSASCTEISTTGVFKWNTSNITTQPTVFTEYLWIMTNSTVTSYGKVALGGYPDTMPGLIWEETTAGHVVAGSMGKKLGGLKNPSLIIDGEIIA